MNASAHDPKQLATPWRILLITAGTISLLMGLIGIVVPGLPTTVFIILAAACYVRSSATLHRWLTSRPYLQSYFAAAQRFEEKRELPLKIKLMAMIPAWLSFVGMYFGASRAPFWVKWVVLGAAIACTVFMLSVKTAHD